MEGPFTGRSWRGPTRPARSQVSFLSLTLPAGHPRGVHELLRGRERIHRHRRALHRHDENRLEALTVGTRGQALGSLMAPRG